MTKIGKPKILLLVDSEIDQHRYRESLLGSFELIVLALGPDTLAEIYRILPELVIFDLLSQAPRALALSEDLRVNRLSKSYMATIVVTDALDAQALEAANGIDIFCTRAQASLQIRALVKSGLRIRSTMHELYDTNQKLGRVTERLKKLSLTDELTGLYNMRFMARQIRNEYKRAERYLKHLSLVSLDIDGFTQVNEVHGHLLGSHILTRIGQDIGDGIRFEIDYAGRSGGDEFLIALPETDLAGAMVVAERMRKKLANAQIENGLQKIQLTASLGVAHFNGPRKNLQNVEELLRKCEQNLKKAKELGNNRVYAEQLANPELEKAAKNAS